MTDKSPIEKIHDAITGKVHGAVADPSGTAAKAAEQARGVLALGFMAVGQVAQTIADRLMRPPPPPAAPPSAPRAPVTPAHDQPTPADVARVVEMKPTPKPRPKPAAKTAPATPSGKLPPRKAPAKKTSAKKAPAKKPPAGAED